MVVQPVYAVKPPRKTSPLLIGCVVVIGAFLLLAVVTAIFSSSSSTSSSSNSLPPMDAAREELRSRATAKLLANKDWSDRVAVTRLCEQADGSKLTTEVQSRCAEAHLGAAEQHLKDGKIQDARRAFDLAVREGTSGSERQALESRLKKVETADAKKQARIEAAAGALARQAYAKALRERYLDQNLDIKVKASGAQNERITLEFALFNDVWAHKFQQGELPDELRKLGFRRVDMTDNYDYHVYWDLK